MFREEKRGVKVKSVALIVGIVGVLVGLVVTGLFSSFQGDSQRLKGPVFTVFAGPDENEVPVYIREPRLEFPDNSSYFYHYHAKNAYSYKIDRDPLKVLEHGLQKWAERKPSFSGYFRWFFPPPSSWENVVMENIYLGYKFVSENKQDFLRWGVVPVYIYEFTINGKNGESKSGKLGLMAIENAGKIRYHRRLPVVRGLTLPQAENGATEAKSNLNLPMVSSLPEFRGSYYVPEDVVVKSKFPADKVRVYKILDEERMDKNPDMQFEVTSLANENRMKQIAKSAAKRAGVWKDEFVCGGVGTHRQGIVKESGQKKDLGIVSAYPTFMRRHHGFFFEDDSLQVTIDKSGRITDLCFSWHQLDEHKKINLLTGGKGKKAIRENLKDGGISSDWPVEKAVVENIKISYFRENGYYLPVYTILGHKYGANGKVGKFWKCIHAIDR